MGRQKHTAIAGLAVAGLVTVIVAGAVVTGRFPGAPAAAATPTGAPTQRPSVYASATANATQLRWFVGLDASPDTLPAEKAFAARYNATNTDGIVLDLEVATPDEAYDVLKTEIAAGNAPDLVGPVGIAARHGFQGLFLDLTPLLERSRVSLAAYDTGILNLLREGWGSDALIGLPYIVDPSFIFYDTEMFRKAGLPQPPQVVGRPYMGKTWDWDELGAIAARLTLDSSGRNATQPGFDPTNIVQYGMDFPGADARVIGSTFGSGSFVQSDGKTIEIPAPWADAWDWYYRAIWSSHIAPTATTETYQLVRNGSPIASGHLAMALTRPSQMSTFSSLGTAQSGRWGLSVIPSWKGTTTAPVDARTFAITKQSSHPDQALKAMLAIESDPELLNAYGGMPATGGAEQDHWLQTHGLAGQAQALVEMEGRAAHPSPYAPTGGCLDLVPSSLAAFLARLQSKPGLNMAAEFVRLKEEVQAGMYAACPLM
jgi:multiple sugar transport system substrate-binding protein